MKTWWPQFSVPRRCSPPRVSSAPAPCSATSHQIPSNADPVSSNQHWQHYLYIMSSACRNKYSTLASAFLSIHGVTLTLYFCHRIFMIRAGFGHRSLKSATKDSQLLPRGVKQQPRVRMEPLSSQNTRPTPASPRSSKPSAWQVRASSG